MGTQINRLSNGISQHHPDADDGDQANDHAEGIVIQKPGLPAAHQGRHRANRARRAIHQPAVDEAGIGLLPKALPRRSEPLAKTRWLKASK